MKVEQELGVQRLWFADQTTPGSKGKPKGAALCEIREVLVAVGGAAPVDPEAMPYLASVTKTPYRNSFEAGGRGQDGVLLPTLAEHQGPAGAVGADHGLGRDVGAGASAFAFAERFGDFQGGLLARHCLAALAVDEFVG